MATSGNGLRAHTWATLVIGRFPAPWVSTTLSLRAISSSSAALLVRPRVVTRAAPTGISSRQRHAGNSPACAWQGTREFKPLVNGRYAGGPTVAKATWNGVVLADSDETVVVEGNHYFPPESLRREFFKSS